MHFFLQFSLEEAWSKSCSHFPFFRLFIFLKILNKSQLQSQGCPREPLSHPKPETEYQEIVRNSQLLWNKLQQFSASLPTNFKHHKVESLLRYKMIGFVLATMQSLQIVDKVWYLPGS